MSTSRHRRWHIKRSISTLELFIMFKTLSASLVALSLVAVAQPASADVKPALIKKLPPIKTLPVITPRPIKPPVKLLTPAEKAAAEAAAKAAAEKAAAEVKAAAGN